LGQNGLQISDITNERKESIMQIRQNSTRWLGVALACGTFTFAASSQAAKPPKPPPTPAGPTYRIVSLGTLGGNSAAHAINESGWVAGGANGGAFVVVPETSPNGPVYYRDTSPADGINDLMLRLPALDPSLGNGGADGINDAGLIVGQSILTEGTDTLVRSTLWLDGLPIDLADGTALSSGAADINNPGVIVTWSGDDAYVVVPEDTNSDGVADLWVRDENGDGINDLRQIAAPLHYYKPEIYGDGWPVYFEPQAINDGGQIVFFANGGIGYYLLTPDDTDADGDGNPWYADVNADLFNDLLVRLQSAGGANDINTAGQVVGMANDRAVRWDFPADGTQTITDLGTLSLPVKRMWATAINDPGQIVGNAYLKNGNHAGFVFYKGTMYDFATRLTNGSGWVNLTPADINNQGFIVGYGTFSGVTQAFVAVPVTQP
jgi:probable HAF family extracellular repeat protein